MLTERQRATFEFVCEYYKHYGFAPKLDEVASGIGIKSKGVVHRYLQAVAEEGLIDLLPGRSRGIRLKGELANSDSTRVTLPLVGKIAAGKPIEAIPDQNSIDLTDFFLGPDRFVLKVQGDSMVEAGILDGDMVVVKKQEYAQDGDIVVALIDNDEATLKFFKKSADDSVMLIPANPTLQAITYSAKRVRVQGVVVGQMRSYAKSDNKYRRFIPQA